MHEFGCSAYRAQILYIHKNDAQSMQTNTTNTATNLGVEQAIDDRIGALAEDADAAVARVAAHHWKEKRKETRGKEKAHRESVKGMNEGSAIITVVLKPA